jgi:hypothetical protein
MSHFPCHQAMNQMAARYTAMSTSVPETTDRSTSTLRLHLQEQALHLSLLFPAPEDWSTALADLVRSAF